MQGTRVWSGASHLGSIHQTTTCDCSKGDTRNPGEADSIVASVQKREYSKVFFRRGTLYAYFCRRRWTFRDGPISSRELSQYCTPKCHLLDRAEGDVSIARGTARKVSHKDTYSSLIVLSGLVIIPNHVVPYGLRA